MATTELPAHSDRGGPVRDSLIHTTEKYDIPCIAGLIEQSIPVNYKLRVTLQLCFQYIAVLDKVSGYTVLQVLNTHTV